jgi:hypothetical protein
MYTSEYCDVRFLDEMNVALVTWKKFTSGREYRLPLMYAAGLMTARKGSNFVADTRDGFEDDPADTQWIFDEFIPRVRKTDCRHVFFIIDRDAGLREELEAQKGELKNYFDVHACFDLDEVKAILKGAGQ